MFTGYDLAYAQKYRSLAQTPLGRAIYEARWRLIDKYCHGPMRLLDYGCASGVFHTASRNGFVTRGYDVNPHHGFDVLPDGPWDVVTLWDVLEHLEAPVSVLQHLNPRWLFLCTPNLGAAPEDVTTWKHYRPLEHLYYFTPKTLMAMLMGIGYDIREYNFEEGRLRDPANATAILTMVAEKR